MNLSFSLFPKLKPFKKHDFALVIPFVIINIRGDK